MMDFVVTGFPKCGTSALMRLIETLDGVAIARVNRSLEVPLYHGGEAAARIAHLRQGLPGRRNGHKFVAYIYNRGALERMVRDNPRMLFIVCVRDPRRSLVSWREMHRRIALDESQTGHFVTQSEESRRFFRDASADEYYRGWVNDRLQYASHIRRLLDTVSPARVMVIDQGVLARDPDRVLAAVAAELGLPCPARLQVAQAHVSYAEKAGDDPLGAELKAALGAENEALQALLDQLATDPRAVVLR